MSDRIKIAIGAPTYNSVERLQNLLTSIEFYTDFEKDNYRVVILDDGTPDLNKRKELVEMAFRCGVDFIQHEKNEGIPKSWNDLTKYFDDAELIILLNDDVEVCNANWLKSFVYFMGNNPKVGNVGFPIVHIDPTTRLPRKDLPMPSEEGIPGLVGAPNGCCFGFRKELWEKIINPDNSIGFWEDLRSFYEEISFGFEIAKMGYYSIQLATPFFHHLGSLTFGTNPELSVREISKYITREEYLDKLRENKNLWIPFEKHEQLALKENYVLRMDYARMMFAKYWGCKDWINNPQAETHHMLIDTLSKLKIKYLDKDLNERECDVN
jgi:GT2 family glycosyltransferase